MKTKKIEKYDLMQQNQKCKKLANLYHLLYVGPEYGGRVVTLSLPTPEIRVRLADSCFPLLGSLQ